MFQSKIGLAPPFGITLIEGEGGPQITCSSQIRSYRVATRDGAALGTVWGLLLPEAAPGLEIGEDRITVAGAVEDARAFEARVLERLSGSFLAVTGGTLPLRLYPDCGASLPIVFCAASRRAASSAGMLLGAQEYAARFLKDRHHRLVESGGAADRWIPGSLTAHAGVTQLTPNHYLDLATWEAVRFWPRPDDFSLGLSFERAVETVSGRLQSFMRAVAESGSAAIALTAGFDSRMLLAAAWGAGVSDRIESFTLTPGKPGLDQIVSGALAGRAGMRHRLVPMVMARPAERARWDNAVGQVIAHVNRDIHPSLRQLEHDLTLTGVWGETGRSRLYQHELSSINDRAPSADLVLARLGRPQEPEVVAMVEAWLAGLEGFPTSVVLDLAYLEMSYTMLWRPAQCAEIPELLPFADRAIQRAFLSVAPEAKGTDRLFRACLTHMWPQALDLPVNRYGNYRDPLAKLTRALQPARLGAFLRARMA